MLQHIECIQADDVWLAERRGRLTASRACAAFKRNAPKKNGSPGDYSSKRRHLMTGLATERVFPHQDAYDKPFQTDAMSRGTDLEPLARAAYMERTGIELIETGFWKHPTLMVGASYDGLTADCTRAIEVKALWPSNHLEIGIDVLDGKGYAAIPEEYQWQITHQMAYMPSLAQVDFVAYCPEFIGEGELVIIPVLRDESKLSEYRDAVEEFLAETAEVEAKVRRLSGRTQ